MESKSHPSTRRLAEVTETATPWYPVDYNTSWNAWNPPPGEITTSWNAWNPPPGEITTCRIYTTAQVPVSVANNPEFRRRHGLPPLA